MFSKTSIVAMLAATVIIVAIYIASGGAAVEVTAHQEDVQTDEGVTSVCMYKLTGKGMNEDDLDMLQRGGFEKKGDAWVKMTSFPCGFEMIGRHLKKAGFEVVEKGKTLVAQKPAKAFEFEFPKFDAAGLLSFLLLLSIPLAGLLLVLRRASA